MAQSIATARKGAKVIGIGGADVRKIESLEGAVERCVRELGGIDFVMYGYPILHGKWNVTDGDIQRRRGREFPYTPFRSLVECF